MDSLRTWEVDEYKATIEAAYVLFYAHREDWNIPKDLVPGTFLWDRFVELNPEARKLSHRFQRLYGETSEHQMSTVVACLWAWKHGESVRFGMRVGGDGNPTKTAAV